MPAAPSYGRCCETYEAARKFKHSRRKKAEDVGGPQTRPKAARQLLDRVEHGQWNRGEIVSVQVAQPEG